MRESTVLAKVHAALGRRPNVRVFRNSSGAFVDPRGRLVRFGVPSTGGGADLIGWVMRNGVAVFLAIEVKSDTGRPTPKQTNFLRAVREAGGIAGVVRSVEEAEALIDG